MSFMYTIYNKYHALFNYSEYAFMVWLLSWILFFILLPIMVHIFGKFRGVILNYGFTWICMFLIIIGLNNIT